MIHAKSGTGVETGLHLECKNLLHLNGIAHCTKKFAGFGEIKLHQALGKLVARSKRIRTHSHQASHVGDECLRYSWQSFPCLQHLLDSHGSLRPARQQCSCSAECPCSHAEPTWKVIKSKQKKKVIKSKQKQWYCEQYSLCQFKPLC